MFNKLLIVVLALLALVGCKSNPYSGVGVVQSEQPVAQRTTEPAIGFAADETYDFAEGQETTYPIVAKVPAGKGSPVLSFEGLPQGATFISKDSKLLWKPSFDDANDPKDPTIREKIYKVKVIISTSGDTLTKMIRYINLKVKDTPRKFVIDVSPSTTISTKEGQKVRATIKISNEDFPKTEHSISTTDVIPGLTITQDSANPLTYYIDYLPDYGVVKVGVNCTGVPAYCTQRITTNISVVSPSGINRTSQITLSVDDSRLVPDVFIPSNLTTYGDTSFEFSVEDPNQEVKPVVNLIQAPPYGLIKIDYRDKFGAGNLKNNWTQTVGVSWYKVPPLVKGTTVIVKFQICNLKEQNKMVNCVNKDVPITVDSYSIALPEVKRQNWGLKEVKYVKEGDVLAVDLPISPNSTASVIDPITDVYVLPGNMSREVYWESGKLWITGLKAGVKNISLIVTTQAGGRLSEPFQYEVLPRDWKNSVLVYKNSYDSESSAFRAFVDSIDIDLDPTNTRPFQARKNAIVSSSYLSSLGDSFAIDLNIVGVKNIFLFGSQLYNLNGKILAELKSQGVNLIQSVMKTDPTINLSDYHVELTLDKSLSADMGTEYSGGGLVTKIPAVFSLTPSSRCIKLGQFYNPNSAASYSIGVQCQRANGGKIVAFGFGVDQVVFKDTDGKDKFVSWIQGQME